MTKPQQLSLVPEQRPHLQHVELRLSDVPWADLVGPLPSAALIDSINLYGVLVPVHYRPLLGKIEILDGARRLRAAQALGMRSVPAIRVAGVVGWQSEEVLSIALHEHRSDNPAVLFAVVEHLVKDGHDQRAIEQATGLTRSRLHALSLLTELHTDLRHAWEDGDLSMTMAARIARLGVAEQGQLAEVFSKTGAVTPADVRRVKMLNSPVQSSLAPQVDAPGWVVQARTLLERLRGVVPISASDLRYYLDCADTALSEAERNAAA